MPPGEANARSSAEEPARRLLAFSVAGQEVAIPIDSIVEITAYRRPTPVPGSGPGVRGLMALRGRMVTVLDLRRCLGLEEGAGEEPGRVIVLRDAGELVGLAAGGGARVLPLGPGSAEPLPAALRLTRRDLFTGALPRPDGGYVLLLDLAGLLRSER